MSPESLDQNYPSQENRNENEKRYLDVERGDVQQPVNSNNQNNSGNTNTSQQQAASQPQRKQIDPVELVKNMLSAGFTPSRSQIASATASLNGSKDSSNTWFAILLQRLIKQKKLRDAKSKK